MDPPKEVAAAGVVELAKATVQATGDARVNLSLPHLLSAASFSRRLGELEAEHSGKEFGEFWNDIFAHGTATVFASIAALEAYTNELFIDYEKVFPGLKSEVMAKLWELYEQKRPLEKYEFALLLKEGQKFDRGAKPYQDVAVLVKLRNGLIHFKPEWFSEHEEHAKLSALLRSRAQLSPFFPSSEPLFPVAGLVTPPQYGRYEACSSSLLSLSAGPASMPVWASSQIASAHSNKRASSNFDEIAIPTAT